MSRADRNSTFQVRMPSSIHLIHRQGDPHCEKIRKVSGSEDEYTSGYWLIPVKDAKKLIGGKIYFHNKQAFLSYYGGTILGYQAFHTGPERGRVMFTFKFEEDCREVRASKDGWRRWVKIVW
jgi:hypothetical protein